MSRKLQSQLDHTQLLLSEMRTDYAALRQQHAEAVSRAMQDSADAAAARMAARDTVRGLQRQLADAQADAKGAREHGAAALADGTEKLEQDLANLRRCGAAFVG